MTGRDQGLPVAAGATPGEMEGRRWRCSESPRPQVQRDRAALHTPGATGLWLLADLLELCLLPSPSIRPTGGVDI